MFNSQKLSTLLGITLTTGINFCFFHTPVKAEWNDFTLCSIRLQKTGITPERASLACGDTLSPRDLSLCVARINFVTEITGEEALAACFRSRRPLEMAQCLGHIHREIISDRQEQNIPPSLILDHCRRSLLPVPFSECVVGLSNRHYYDQEREVVAIPLAMAMTNCISATPF